METLTEIKKYAEEVSGLWDGDESGSGEEKAQCANEIIEKVKEIRALLLELEDF